MWLNTYKEDERLCSINKMLDQIRGIFFDDGADTYFKEFYDTVLSIPNIEELVLERGLDLVRVSSIYENLISNISLSRKQIIDSILFNYNFNFWQFTPQLPNNFSLEKDESYHPEACNQISINFEEPNKPKDSFQVSTFNFYFVVYSEDDIQLRINNLQGSLKTNRPSAIKDPDTKKYRRATSQEWKRIIHRIYSKLNFGLKENWQTYIVQEICKTYWKEYKVCGDMPTTFCFIDKTPADVYLKYLLDYMEHFLAWWIDVKNIDVRLVSQDFKQFIKTILETISKFSPEDQIRFVKLLKKKYMVYVQKLNVEKEKFKDFPDQEDFIRESLMNVLNFKNHP